MWSVGVGPDWARVWTFLVGRKKRTGGYIVEYSKERRYKRHSRNQRRRKAGPASRVGRFGSNSQKFMTRRFDLRARGAIPGSYRSRKIYATPHRRKVKYERCARATALTKERSRSLMSNRIIDSIICGTVIRTNGACNLSLLRGPSNLTHRLPEFCSDNFLPLDGSFTCRE